MEVQVKNVLKLILCLLIAAAVFYGGYAYRDNMVDQQAVTVPDDNDNDLKLPGETEKRIVTKDEVEGKLKEIEELATYSEEYKVSKSVDQSRYLLDEYRIPGTKNTIDITCSGIVKVGYDIKSIDLEVDDKSMTISITLPDAAVLDNYVIWDTVVCKEANNFLNPIDFSQYQMVVSEIEDEGLKKAEDDGIYDAAKTNAEDIIRNFLACFSDYTVVFTN